MKKNIKNFNWKLFGTLMFISLIPTIYNTIRVYFLGDFDDPYIYSIAAQISWLNIFYEVLSEAIIIPLFFLISRRKDNFSMLSNRIKTGFYLNFMIYLFSTIIIMSLLNPILNFMIEDPVLRAKSAEYIFLEILASFFYSIFKYVLVIWMILSKDIKMIISFLVQMCLIILFDTFFVSKINVSLNLSIIGIAISNILTNIILVIFNIYLLFKFKINLFLFKNLNFIWMIQYWKIGWASGLESLVRNLFFTYMVLKILNDIGNSGDYWVANNFIWSWLLIPVLALGNTIKSEGENNKEQLKSKLIIYLLISSLIILIWLVTIPGYQLFIHNVLNVQNYSLIVKLVLILLPFYIIFAYNAIFDGIIIGWGRTDLLLYQSLFTNICVYVPYFICLQTGIWIPSVESVAIMFGLGILIDGILTIILFVILTKFNKSLKFKFFRSNEKPSKTFIFGMPTIGKTTFAKNNPNIAWDSEHLYQLTSSLNQNDYNTFINDINLSKKLIRNTNKKLLKTNFDLCFYSILPIELYEEIDWLIYKNINIIFINRSGVNFQDEWNKRNEKNNYNKDHLELEEAQLSSSFIEEQANFFDLKLINLDNNKYVDDELINKVNAIRNFWDNNNKTKR